MGIGAKVRGLIDLYHLWRKGQVERISDPFAQLRNKNAELESRVTTLTRQLDLLKSSVEVPFEMIDEFQEWKATHPIPERPLVSVCLATFNRARLLTERCIPSILAQTYSNLELIVVGDGCTDETEHLVGKIGDARLRFINLPERGRYPQDPTRRWLVAGTPAVNHAMSEARGDFVTHLDDDDEHSPNRLEKLLAFARSEQCDLVWHPFWYENAAGEWVLQNSEDFAWTHVTTSSVLYRSWLTRIQWDVQAHRLMEPGDWNRFRRIKYVGAICRRYPEPLLRHYRESGRELKL